MSRTLPDPEGDRRLAPVITWRTLLVDGTDCSTCKLVGLVLSLYMNERGGSAFPANARLAEDCSLGVSTVREHLNDHLHKQGWLTLVERGGQKGERRRANEWQASTPPDHGGVGQPRQLLSQPRQLTAVTPPDAGPQVVHEEEQEVAGGHLKCSACGSAGFSDTEELADHQESGCLALHEEDGDFQSAREELRKAGGRG